MIGIKQKSKEWYDIKRDKISSSEIASILDCNPYQSPHKLLIQKINNYKIDNINTQWGNKYEKKAIEYYENITNSYVDEVGLLVHPIYPFICSSPDGIIKNKLLEIKCPKTRQINNRIMFMYWIQIQIQLEVFDKSECDYFEVKIENDEVIQYYLTTVKRDQQWFDDHIDEMKEFYNEMINSKKYIHINKIKNYMIDDPIIDYLEDLEKNNPDKLLEIDPTVRCENLFNKIISDKKNKFKKEILSKLDGVFIKHSYKFDDRYADTLTYMNLNIKIILDSMLCNSPQQLYLTPDILIHKDQLKILYNIESETPYNIIDIVYKNIKYGNSKEISYYKGKLHLYKKIIDANYYIMTKYKKLIHIVDTNDKADKAIEWLRNITEYPPNMCNMNVKWNDTKKIIADKTNDITALWNCSVIHRDIALRNGITNWKTHENLTTKMFGIYGKRVKTLQVILDVNRSNSTILHPTKLTIKQKKILKPSIDYYIDFETINKELTGTHDIIFLIGVYDTVNYKYFICDDLTEESEKKMLIEFNNYISFVKKRKRTKCNIFHWGVIEKYLYINAIKKYELSDLITDKMVDLLVIFKQYKIVCKYMLNFSLKSVVGAFYKNGFIDIKYDSLSNGLDAMVESYIQYNTNKDFESVISYNKTDCVSLYKIVEYIRYIFL